jgi:uncharacterized protein YbgA (DUF1722 family)
VWIYSSIGFFSLTNHRDRPDTVMVRGRVRSDMERFLQALPEAARQSEIIETHDTDYRYRILADRQATGDVVGKLAANMDYIGFKDTVADKYGNLRKGIYMSIWELTHELQEYENRLLLQERTLNKKRG